MIGDNKTYGQVCYEAFIENRVFKMPHWDSLSDEDKQHWERAAEAAVDEFKDTLPDLDSRW
jgi:hypothetical protein